MNASDLSCRENVSANQGLTGYRGITGAKGIPGTSGTKGVPGQPGPSGSSRIDIACTGYKGEPYLRITSPRLTTFSYVIFPGSTAWGRDLQKVKIASSINKAKLPLGAVVTVTYDVTDITDSLNPVSIFSAPLTYSITADTINTQNKDYKIVQNGDDQNLYTTIDTIPSSEALLAITASISVTGSGRVRVPSVDIYSIELY